MYGYCIITRIPLLFVELKLLLIDIESFELSLFFFLGFSCGDKLNKLRKLRLNDFEVFRPPFRSLANDVLFRSMLLDPTIWLLLLIESLR